MKRESIQPQNDMRRELIGRKEDFQRIVRQLVEFDERSGRARASDRNSSHALRRAVGTVVADQLRIFLTHLGGHLYYIVVEIESGTGYLATAWVLEDGIRMEREEHSADRNHPVHSVVCMSDLYESSATSVTLEELEEQGVSEELMELLLVSRRREELAG